MGEYLFVVVRETNIVDQVIVILVHAFLTAEQQHIGREMAIERVTHLVEFLDNTGRSEEKAVVVGRLSFIFRILDGKSGMACTGHQESPLEVQLILHLLSGTEPFPDRNRLRFRHGGKQQKQKYQPQAGYFRTAFPYCRRYYSLTMIVDFHLCSFFSSWLLL